MESSEPLFPHPPMLPSQSPMRMQEGGTGNQNASHLGSPRLLASMLTQGKLEDKTF